MHRWLTVSGTRQLLLYGYAISCRLKPARVRLLNAHCVPLFRVPSRQVVPVVARGLVLPVLVAVRDIQPGEELLRDYGAEWWREKGFVRAWRYLTGSRRFDDRTMEGLLGAGADAAAGH